MVREKARLGGEQPDAFFAEFGRVVGGVIVETGAGGEDVAGLDAEGVGIGVAVEIDDGCGVGAPLMTASRWPSSSQAM